MLLLSSAVFFFKIIFYINSFRNTIRVSDGFDPGQDLHSVGPNLGPNCKVYKQTKVTTSKERVYSLLARSGLTKCEA